MNATKKLTLALALALGSSQVLALGLGQIRVKSALNQPLRAEIPVLADNAAELSGLEVALASPEAFARAGLNLSRMDVPLKFKLVRHGGTAVIEVTTDKPVGEPALDFLIEVNWANGKLLREYSVLLDPPVTVAAAQPVAPAAAAPTPAPVPTPTPVRSKPASTAPVAASPAAVEPVATPVAAPAPSAPAPAAAGATYTVASGDTLWRIASDANGGEEVERMMLALQRLNPEAFINDNINTIRRGAVLRIPGQDEVASIANRAAHAEVRRQMDQWRANQPVAPTLLGQVGGNTQASAGKAAAPTSDSHLELVPPGKSGSAGEGNSGVTDGRGSAQITGLKQDLSRAREALASEQQKSGDLGDRVKSLEGINDKNQRLLELKNSEIAELQNKLAEAAEATSAAEAARTAALAAAQAKDKEIWGQSGAAGASSTANVPASAATAALALAGSVASVAVAASAPPVVSTPAVASSPTEITKAPEAKPAQVTPAAPAAELPWYMRPLNWLIGGLALLVVLLIGWFSRRSKPGASAQANAVDVADATTVGDYGEDSEDEYALIDELEQHPEELSLHLELASLYYAHRDQAKFEAAAERMHAYVDDPHQVEWQQVRAMGEELCPDHPLFGTDYGDSHDAFDSGHLDDSDDESRPASAAAESLAGMAGAGLSEATDAPARRGYNFDFDLTPPAVPASAGDTLADEEIDFGDDALLGGGDLPVIPPADSGLEEVGLESDSTVPLATADDDDFTSTFASDGAGGHVSDEGFSSDPVDTKLDLARAYQEMGDAEGARAMLEEVMQEGSTAQQDIARKLLDELN